MAGSPLLLAALTATTTVSVPHPLHAEGPGAALAWDLSAKLESGEVKEEELVRIALSLGLDDRRAFLGAWTMARPDSTLGLSIQHTLEESIVRHGEIDPATEPGQPRLVLVPGRSAKPSSPVVVATDQAPSAPPDPVVAGLLSSLAGFGVGAYYAGDTQLAAVMLLSQVGSVIALAVGIAKDDAGVTSVGVGIFAIARGIEVLASVVIAARAEASWERHRP